MNAENPAQPVVGGPFQPVTAQPTAGGPAGGAQTGSTPFAPITGNQPATPPPTAAPQQQQQPQQPQARPAQAPVAAAPAPTGAHPTSVPPTGAQPAAAAQQPRQPAHPGAPQTGPQVPPQTAQQAGRPAAPGAPGQQAAAPHSTGAQPTGTQPTGTQPTGTQATTGTQQGAPRRASFKTTGQIPTTGAAAVTGTQAASGETATEEPKKKSRMAALANLGSNKSKDVTDTEPSRASKGGPRKVRVMVSTVDPWSIMKLAFLTAVSAGIMLVIGVSIVWNVLNSMGVFADIKEQIVTLFAIESEVQILQFFDYGRWMSATILVSVFNVVVATALATIGSLLYNVVVKLVGGVYVTLTDE